MSQPGTELLTIPEVAVELRASRSTVKRRIRTGALAAYVDGRLVRVRRADLERYKAEHVRLSQAAPATLSAAGRDLEHGRRLWD